MFSFSFPVRVFTGPYIAIFRQITSLDLPACFVLLVAVCAVAGCGGSFTQTGPSSAPLAITTSSLPSGQMGSPYTSILTASGGTTPYTWSLTSGALPAGLLLNASTGAITGTPTAAANATSLTFLLTDSGSPAQTKSVSLVLTIAASGPLPINITTTSLPNGQMASPYSATLAASGGTTPYVWSLTSGTLPAGLALNASTGAITGTPTATANATSLTFLLTDSGSPAQTQSVNLALTIAASGTLPLSITTTSLPNGQVASPYGATLAATGGTTPYSWSLTSGTLPAGLTLNASTGAITGTPTAAANAISLTFKLTDSGSPAQTQSASLTLTIAAATLSITTSALPSGQVGTPYSATLAATGGTTPYTWSLTSGTLPAGLLLNASTGAITGTPTATANATSLTFKLTDSSGPVQTKSVTLALTIATSGGTLSITTTTLPNGQVASPYSATLAATGGTTPYTWSLTSGTLPAGLALNASTGAITGTPTAAANATSLTFQLTDSSSPTQTKSVTVTLTIAPVTLSITTTSLPSGQVGSSYSAILTSAGGTTPYTWSLTSGTLPAGLALNASTGAITGTPTATANATSLTFKLTDSSSPAQTKSVTVTLTIVSSGISVSLSLKRAALTVTQPLPIVPTTNDSAGVNWSATGSGCSGAACGSFSSSHTLGGVAITFTAPSTAGLYTVTATSVTDASVSSSVAVAVTDLAGVTTYHNNISRNGANTQEYALTTSMVATSTFGKLFSCSVDSAVYAQPLWVPNLTISSAKHNVILVATQNDSLYAFDADTNSTPCTPLWHANLIDSTHGANSGETAVPSYGSGALVGNGSGDIAPEVGVTGTPVIDPATNTLYVVSKSAIASGPSFYQRLHAIDLLTGHEKFSASPVTIAATYPGTGDGGTTTTFVARQENQRPGLALVNGVVYIAWASHEDNPPWYGWVIGYNANDLSQASVFNDAPNAGLGGIWMSGGAPAADSSGNLYLITGNGNFDASSSTAPNNDYGDSFLKLTSGLSVSQYFTPSDQSTDNSQDHDFGSGGAAVLVDLPMNGTNPTHLVIGGGKDGTLYLLNRDSMGGLGDSNAWQPITLPGGIFSTGAFWNSNFYIATNRGSLLAFSLSPGTAKLTQAPNVTSVTFAFPSGTPSVSSMPDNSNGIVWILDNSPYCTQQSHSCGPAILHAFDAGDLATELWNSTQGTGNSAGNAVKFAVPTVANGKVYVGTRGNNTGGADSSTSIAGELDVYGILPN